MSQEPDICKLEEIARTIRARIIETSHRTNTPHLGSCLSCVDVLVAAYFQALRIDPAQPRDPERDRFILSKGHGAAALFQVLGMRGYYPEALLETYGQDGGLFAEHPPAPEYLPGIEAATGSLGHGLPMGLGMALAARMHGRNYNVIALLSDGECNEGSVWEAAMMAASQKVERLAVFIDFNKWQATGRSEEILALSPLVDKWRTPILVIHGERDYRVPVTHGLAAFTAAQAKGVPSKFLMFPNENHWVLNPNNSIQWHREVLRWLDQWLKP